MPARQESAERVDFFQKLTEGELLFHRGGRGSRPATCLPSLVSVTACQRDAGSKAKGGGSLAQAQEHGVPSCHPSHSSPARRLCLCAAPPSPRAQGARFRLGPCSWKGGSSAGEHRPDAAHPSSARGTLGSPAAMISGIFGPCLALALVQLSISVAARDFVAQHFCNHCWGFS